MADKTSTSTPDRVRIGLVSVSDRASAGVYEDKGIPALRDWLSRAILNPVDWETRLVADEEALISASSSATRRVSQSIGLRIARDSQSRSAGMPLSS